jgi:hypothetical protein
MVHAHHVTPMWVNGAVDDRWELRLPRGLTEGSRDQFGVARWRSRGEEENADLLMQSGARSLISVA